MANPVDAVLRASAAAAASGVGDSVDLLDEDELERKYARLTLEVTALSGGTTPTLTVSVQTSPSGSSWSTVASFTAKTAVGYERLVFGPLERYARVTWTLSAGASATFSVTGQSEVSYADHQDFYRYGLPESAVSDTELPSDAVACALLAATDDADSSIPRSAKLPLVQPYPFVLRQKVCQLAAGNVLAVRGYDANDQADSEVKERSTAAERWFERMALGRIEPPWVDATPEEYEGGPIIDSDTLRGWGD